jgi:serine/threonine-protein kinase RsbW
MAGHREKIYAASSSSTENLALIREFVVTIGGQAGACRERFPELELAVDEACANVIEHAYGHDVTKDVTIRVSFDDMLCVSQ